MRLLSSILRAWHLDHEHAHWSAGTVQGRVDFAKNDLTIDVDAGARLKVCPGSIFYRPVGESVKTVQPVGTRGLVQEPYLVVPCILPTEVGLRLVSQVLVEPDAVTMDFRIETIAPLDDLSMELTLNVQEGTVHPCDSTWTSVAGRLTRRELHALDLRQGNEVVATFRTDLGEGGHGELDQDQAKVHITFFEQPLEKGVILIGRWGVIRRLPDESEEKFYTRQAGWLERRTFL